MHEKTMTPCSSIWTTHLHPIPPSLRLIKREEPWPQLFSTDLNNRQTLSGQAAISQTADTGRDGLAVMFYRRCKRDGRVSFATVWGEGQQINRMAACLPRCSAVGTRGAG